jgi:GNAT superfamily N-acetyltransferase
MGYEGGTDNTTVSWMVSHPETEIYVAADAGDRVVGLVTLSHRPALRARGRIAFIDELVVAGTWRRKGVGSALLHHAAERARTLSVKRLEVLHSEELGEVPRAFFESCGLKSTDGAIYRAPGDFTERRT